METDTGGHGLLEAVPRIYQVTPDIPDRRRATKHEGSQALARPTASKRVSSPPVGNLPSASDVTDEPNHNSKPRRSSSACGARCRTGSVGSPAHRGAQHVSHQPDLQARAREADVAGRMAALGPRAAR